MEGGESCLRAIVETAADAILTFDHAGIVRSFNPAAERMFGYSAAEILGRPVGLLVRTQGESKPLPGGAGFDAPSLGHHKSGSTFPAEFAVSEAEGLGLFTAIVRDISEHHREQALIADVAIAEQVRIGRDLHDTVGQELAALALFAERASRRMECEPGTEVLAELAVGIRGALAHVRTAARGLTRVADDAESLFLAIQELASSVETNHEIGCRFEAESHEPVSGEIANHLYRIASEAVSNAVHHARPARIDIRLAVDGGRLTLRVADDGIGIDQTTENPGVGTWIMRSRAAAIGAELEIEGGAAGGTVVTCRLKGGEHGTSKRGGQQARPDRR